MTLWHLLRTYLWTRWRNRLHIDLRHPERRAEILQYSQTQDARQNGERT